MGTPIRIEDIRKGDRVREITRTVKERTSDYTAGCDRQTLDRHGIGDKSWELLDRPRKLIHEAGKTLWFHPNHIFNPNAQVRVTKDFHEGDCDVYVEVVSNATGRYRTGYRSGWLPSNFTDARPRKVIHAKGTTLYLKHAHRDAKKGDPVTVLEDCFEDQHMVQAIQANGFKDGYPYEYWLTTEKPRVLKWAKGTTLYVKEGMAPLGGRDGDPVVLRSDHYEGDTDVDIEYGGSINGGIWFARRFTDEKPEPHPVGAIRWVTEDCKSPYGYKFKKGDRVEVSNHTQLNGFPEVHPSPECAERDPWGYGIDPKFLSETLVEPAYPTVADAALVAVPLPAIEKLRDENDRAYGAFGTGAKNDIRRTAIGSFLNNTREVKTALRGDEW